MPQETFDLDIESKHYKRNMEFRAESRVLYEGRPQQILDSGFLLKGTYEEIRFFEERKKRLVYENLERPIISARIGLLTRKSITLTTPAAIAPYMEDVDGQGTAYDAWLQQTATDADIDGIAWALVDVPNTFNLKDPDGRPLIISKQDEIDANIRPYLKRISADDVIRWKLNSVDYKFDWVVFRMNIQEEEVIGHPAMFGQRWIVWSRDMIQVYIKAKESSREKGYILVQEYPNTIGEVPLVAFYGIKDKFPYTGLPFCYSVLGHLKRILNVESLVDHTLELVTMPRLFLMGVDMPTEVPTANNAFFLPYGENGEKPDAKFIEPSGRGVELANERIADLITRVFKNTLFWNRKMSAQVQSAESQKAEGTIMKADLSSAALNHETSSNEVLRLFYKWETGGQEPNDSDYGTSFTRDFDVSKLSAQEITALGNIVDRGDLSLKTFWDLLLKGEVLFEDFDAEEEFARIAAQQDVAEKNLDINSL